MAIDCKENVKNKIKIFENDYFTTYCYEFENGNKYNECETKWIQRDFSLSVFLTPEERLERRLGDLIYKR